MNVHGIRMRLRADPETGLPPEEAPPGVVRFYRLQDNSRQGRENEHKLEMTIPVSWVPFRRSDDPLKMPEGVLLFNPNQDVWSAPDQVEWIDLVCWTEPERLAAIRPRLASWSPA